MNKGDISICNFCSSDIAITKCINCGCNSCGKNIYCCQIIQKRLNENSVICNMCYIEISHKLKPYNISNQQKKKMKKNEKKNKKCNELHDMSMLISNLDKRIKLLEKNNHISYDKKIYLRNTIRLINESSQNLLKKSLMNI